MNIVTRFGNWIEKHWPEKMTTLDVHNMIGVRFATVEVTIKDLIGELSLMRDRLSKIESELNIFKTQSIVKARMSGDKPAIFATRLSSLAPVQPAPQPTHAAAGGNGSPQ